MSKVEIFDAKMVAAVGIDGAIVDQEAVRIAGVINALKKENKDIVWYNYANNLEAYHQNKLVNDLLMKEGPDILPITVVEGKIIRVGAFPSNLEIANWLGMTQDELVTLLLKAGTAVSTSGCLGCSDKKNGCGSC